MIEATVSVVINRIKDLLIHEAGLLSGVREFVKRLQAELMRMQCFLKDADIKQEQDTRVSNRLNEIRALAYDIENVIDDFLLKLNAYTCQSGLRRVISRLTCMFSRAAFLHKTGNQIRCIRAKIGDISAAMQTYGIQFTGEEEHRAPNFERRMQRLRRSYAHAEEDHIIIGLEGSTRNVMNELMKEESKLCVVSIVGMGGLGKTTLAKKIYDHLDVRRHFDCCSWSFISQQFSVKDVLHGILNEFGAAGGMKEEELVRTLYDVLKEKRYLVVLDDIWQADAWDLLKPAFPKGKSGSKVLFTTRNKEVAFYADPWSSTIELPFLTAEEGWELLHARAFPREPIDDIKVL